MNGRPLLLFLHGIGARGCSFSPLMNQLTELESKFKFIPLDFTGFANTPVPKSNKKASIELFARQAISAIESASQTNNPQIHIIGHSMGGAVGIEIHKMNSSLNIKSFINLEGILLPTDCDLMLKISQQSKETFCNSGWDALKKDVRNFASKGDKAAQDWILGLNETTPETFWESCCSIIQKSESFYSPYKNWKIPKLYVVGEKTLKHNKGTHDRLLKDNQKIVVVPGAGHVMQVEQPEFVAKVCRKHLENLI